MPPPLTITPRLVDLISLISEALGRWGGQRGRLSPTLRRENRIRSINASLAIENNSLTLSQVSDILDGKPVAGPLREIQEVKNAIAAYELLTELNPSDPADFLKAHGALMQGLSDDAGRFRSKGVGIYKGDRLVHIAPGADRAPHLIEELFTWMRTTPTHPLLTAATVHYEIEFIHPFSDGNGRIGRLWQTLILFRWKPLFAFLPVESVVHAHQSEYYEALSAADKAAEIAPFAEFMLEAILKAIPAPTEQVSEHVTDQVKRLVAALKNGKPLTAAELMKRLGLRHRPTFLKNYLQPALAAGLITMTQPHSPRSPTQRYCLT